MLPFSRDLTQDFTIGKDRFQFTEEKLTFVIVPNKAGISLVKKDFKRTD